MSQNLFIDHSVVFEEAGEKYAAHAGVLQMLKNPLHYPVQIYIHKGMSAGPIPLHHHAGIELIYSRNKKFTVTIDGKKTCLDPGGFVLISNEALHSVVPSSDGVRQDVMYVSFQPDYLQQMSPYLCSQEFSAASKMAEEEERRLAELCEQLREHAERSSESEILHFETNQILFAMLQRILHEFIKKEYDSKQYQMRCKMTEVLDYLQDHYQENLTTQSVADYFEYTREYFCRLFKRYANDTFKSYLTEIRIIAVAQRLQNFEGSAAQIAIEQGFPDTKSFFAAIKKKYGMTPAHWQAKISDCLEKEKTEEKPGGL